MSTPEELIAFLTLRVDSLELASKEKQKPWYRQPSVILSVAALILSVVTTVYIQVTTNQETIRAKKEELRKLVIALVELHQEARKSLTSPMDGGGQLLTAKQGVYLQAADRLVQQLPRDVSSYEYLILANEHGSSGDSDKAEKYFSEAAIIGTTPLDRAQSLRMLAVAHFSPGPRQNFEKGRQTFEKVNEALKAQTDPYFIDARALTYEAWATMEFQNGFSENAKKRAEDARKEYSNLPPNFPHRQQRLEKLQDRIESGNSISESDSVSPLVKSIARAPTDVRQVLARLSEDDTRWIMEDDIDTATVTTMTEGSDRKANQEDKQTYEHWAKLGLVAFMSDAEIKAKNKKEKKHYAYGVRGTELRQITRDFLFNSVHELVAASRERQQ